MRYLWFIFIILFAGGTAVAVAQPSDTATYQVEFRTTWSKKKHPVNFPSNPHFSGLIGTTHNDQLELWARGKRASDGMEEMAESGDQSGLKQEITKARKAGKAKTVMSGSPKFGSPMKTSLNFTIDKNFPLVTLVSMIAPSPDWFVGVHNLSLLDSYGKWIDKRTVKLRAYDAGTDNGEIYNSYDDDTQPRGKISLLSSASKDTSFGKGKPYVGTFTFRRIK